MRDEEERVLDNIYLPPVIVSPRSDCLLGAPFLEDVLLLAEDGAPLPAEDVLEQGLPEELQEAGHVPARIHLLQTLSSIMTADCLCFYIRWSIAGFNKGCCKLRSKAQLHDFSPGDRECQGLGG